MIEKFNFNAVNPRIEVAAGSRVNVDPNDSYLNVDIELIVENSDLLKQYEETGLVEVDGNTVRYKQDVFHNTITASVYAFVENNYENKDILIIMLKCIDTLNIWKR
jgi:hypothetical protein